MQATANRFFFVVTCISHVCIHACLHTYVDVSGSYNRTRSWQQNLLVMYICYDCMYVRIYVLVINTTRRWQQMHALLSLCMLVTNMLRKKLALEGTFRLSVVWCLRVHIFGIKATYKLWLSLGTLSKFDFMGRTSTEIVWSYILWAEQAQKWSDHTFYGQNKHRNWLIIHFLRDTTPFNIGEQYTALENG